MALQSSPLTSGTPGHRQSSGGSFKTPKSSNNGIQTLLANQAILQAVSAKPKAAVQLSAPQQNYQAPGYSGGYSSEYAGSYGGGSGGSGGGETAAQAAAAEAAAAAARKAAITAQYTPQINGTNTTYDAAIGQVNGQLPAINQTYNQAINAGVGVANRRVDATNAAQAQRTKNEAVAAQRMGLPVAPGAGTHNADQVDAINKAAINTDSNAWRTLLREQRGTSVARNNAAAQNFKVSKEDELSVIQKQILAALGLA